MEIRKTWFWYFFGMLMLTVFGLFIYMPTESLQMLYRSPGIQDVVIWYQSTQTSHNTGPGVLTFTQEFKRTTPKSTINTHSASKSSPRTNASFVSALIAKLTISPSGPKVAKTTNGTTIRVSKIISTTRRVINASSIKTTTAPKRTKFFICPIYTGRVGNLMFQYASSYGIAVAKNMSVVIQESNILNRLFTLKAEIRKDISFCSKMKVKGESLHCGYDPNLSKFEPTQDYRLAVYLQSWKYFENVTYDLRQQFTFKPDIKKRSELIINKMLSKRKVTSRADVILVGVHIRRGDFVNNKYGYEVATKEYLQRAVKYFTDRFINVLFIVCTNDLRWTKENMPPVAVEYTENNSAEVDMCILSMCNNTILSVGTFGWWAAWLNKGTTIFFKWPAKEGSPLRKDFSKNYTDYFPPKWIGM